MFDGIKAGLAGARPVHLLPGRGRSGWRPSWPRAPRTPARRAGAPPGRRGAATTWRPTGCIKGAGGGDGGLFNGVTARYLALVATTLPGDTPEDTETRDTAAQLVLKSAQSAWDYRQTVDGLPLFGPFWDRTADMPSRRRASRPSSSQGAVNASEIPERDLSVQLSGWMLMEAAHAIAASGDNGTADE